jgi:CRP-like cAMP-binding protein
MDLVKAMRHEVCVKGETVFRYGDPPDKFYIILDGRVGVLVPIILNT